MAGKGYTRINRRDGLADGFAGDSLEPIVATHRPTGLAVAPDGALFISDDQRGRIWRVVYVGSRPSSRGSYPSRRGRGR